MCVSQSFSSRFKWQSLEQNVAKPLKMKKKGFCYSGTVMEILKPSTSGLYEKKHAVYYFLISFFVPEMFKFLKYAN